MTNIVILGDGLLGSELKKLTNWDVISRRNSKFDISNPNSYSSFLKDYDIIINCIANTNTYSEDSFHYKVNYKFVVDLVDYANKENKKIIHISTGYVYENNNNSPSESDFPMYQSTKYAYYKNLADAYIKIKSHDYVIIRSIHKPNPFPYMVAFEDHYGNFSYVNEVCDFIIDCITMGLSGIYNVGREFMSMFEFAKITNLHVKSGKKPDHIPKKIQYNCDKYKNYLIEKHNISR
jgi:dTDP-4-dehydrorhamnose reductase